MINQTKKYEDMSRRSEESRKKTENTKPEKNHNTSHITGGDQGPPSFNILLLSSLGRSGSSFLGELLATQAGVFYYFEPLRNIEARKQLQPDTVHQALQALFTCNVSGLVINAMQNSSPYFTLRNRYGKTCKRKCFHPKKLNEACRKEPIRLVKTIRMRVASLPPLLDDAASKLKVIHLVRDPRGSLISYQKLKWHALPEVSCNYINHDLRNGTNLLKQYPGRYMAVRYEDLCMDPEKMARMIFSFLGYHTLPPATVSFLERFTSRDNASKKFNIKRNSRRMLQQWRSVITQDQLVGIEKACGSTINNLGFHLFHDLHNARNLSLPLYVNSTQNNFFLYNVVD
nr:carbohydrate sulfotransferase 3-like [Procambarus clarkii]